MAKSSNADLGTETMMILDHANGFQCRTESDNFFISIPCPPNTSINEDFANSRTPKSMGRNGFLSSSFKTITSKGNPLNPNAPDKLPDITDGQKHHHQITITTGKTSTPTTGSGSGAGVKRSSLRSNSFKRTALKFILKPRNVAIFFASVSSAGSILLLFGIMMNNKNVFNNEEVYYY